MAYSDDVKKVGESWVWYVEIEPRTCDEVYGVAPCTASGGQCAYSWATCEDKDNFDLTTRVFKFSSKRAGKIFPGEQVSPSLISVSDIPTEINPEKSTTINARIQMTFEDTNNPPPFNSDKGAGKFYDNRNSTFWRRFNRVYRESYKYCRIKIYEGLASYTSVSDFSLRRELFMSNIAFGNDGKVTITGTDKTRLTKTIKVPNAISSTNVLTQPVTSSSAIIDVTDASEFKLLQSPYRSFIKIIDPDYGDEYIEFDGKDDTLNELDLPSSGGRGLFGTVEVDHAAGCKVIQVAVFADIDDVGNDATDVGVNPVDAIKEIILAWVEIPSADVDTAQFDSERDSWYEQLQYRRIVETPIQADKLISQLNQFMMSNVWQDEDQLITFKAFAPVAPGGDYYEFDTSKNVLDNSVQVDNKTEKQVSRVTVHFRPTDTWGTKDHKEADEFNDTLIWINAEAENSNGQGEPVEIEFFADWIYNTSEARSFTSRYIRRFSPTAPKEIRFACTRRDGEVQTGDNVDFISPFFVWDDGEERTVNFQILSKIESQRGVIKMKALETKFARKYGFICPSGYPDWTYATDEQREYAYICFLDSDGTVYMSDGGPVTYIW